MYCISANTTTATACTITNATPKVDGAMLPLLNSHIDPIAQARLHAITANTTPRGNTSREPSQPTSST